MRDIAIWDYFCFHLIKLSTFQADEFFGVNNKSRREKPTVMDFVWKPQSNSWKGNERRKSPRHGTDQPVRIVVVATGSTIHGKLQNLSETGCCVEPDEPFLVWNPIRVEIRFEANQTSFRLSGMTRGSRGGNSFGVEFDSVAAERLAELKLLLPKRQMPLAQPRMLQPVEEVQPEPVKPNGPPEGRNRRNHERFSLEEPADLLIVGSGEKLPAKVLDISQSGCRIGLNHPREIKQGINIELNLRLNGLPVRLGGVIQVRLNERTYGIKYLELSGRKRDQMIELIAEIQEAVAKTKTAKGEHF